MLANFEQSWSVKKKSNLKKYVSSKVTGHDRETITPISI